MQNLGVTSRIYLLSEETLDNFKVVGAHRVHVEKPLDEKMIHLQRQISRVYIPLNSMKDVEIICYD